MVSSWEKDMWEYFGSLYKNCNKGIKGRGKDRRISNTGLSIGDDSFPKQEDDSRRNSYCSMSSFTSDYSQPGPADSMDALLHNGSFSHAYTMSPNSQTF